jgi:hypothetical protein
MMKPIREPVLRIEIDKHEFISRVMGLTLEGSFNKRDALMQIVGAKAKRPCGHCIKGIGPYTSCVFVEGIFGGCCANCMRHRRASCSLVGKSP